MLYAHKQKLCQEHTQKNAIKMRVQACWVFVKQCHTLLQASHFRIPSSSRVYLSNQHAKVQAELPNRRQRVSLPQKKALTFHSMLETLKHRRHVKPFGHSRVPPPHGINGHHLSGSFGFQGICSVDQHLQSWHLSAKYPSGLVQSEGGSGAEAIEMTAKNRGRRWNQKPNALTEHTG